MIARSKLQKASRKGWLGFFVALSFILSTTTEYRLEIGPLYVHAYLLLIPFALLVAPFSWKEIDSKVSTYLFLFGAVFTLSCIFDVADIPHAVKVLSAILTFLFFAQSMANTSDFRLISYGVILCSVFLGFKTLFLSEESDASRISSGVVALEGIGNKNAQSLYMLPGLFLSSLFLSDAFRVRRWGKAILNLSFILVMVIGLILTANRSGWLVAAIVLLFAIYRSGVNFRLLVFAPLFYFMIAYYVENFASDIVDRKYEQTFVTGYVSDDVRYFILFESLKAGFERPILGYGPMGLAELLANRAGSLGYQGDVLDPHNLFGYLMGGSGLISFTLFILFLYALPLSKLSKINNLPSVRDSRTILIFFILIFLLRAFFTREILYSPTFIATLGLVYAHYKYVLRANKNLFTSNDLNHLRSRYVALGS